MGNDVLEVFIYIPEHSRRDVNGKSCTPQRERPWSVCRPLRLRLARVDREGAGVGAIGLVGGAVVL
jgi:hypothetical protein